MSSPTKARASGTGQVSEGRFWQWYERLAYPLAAVFGAAILRCGTDYLLTGHAVVHKFTEYGAHRVFYPVIMAGATGAAVWWVMRQSRLWERWAFWKPDRAESGRALVVSAIFVLALLLEVFTAGTVLLLTHHAVTVSGGRTSAATIYGRTELLYLWQIVDAIPAIDATKTLNWQAPYHLDGLSGGSLLLGFKILVLLPIVGAFVDFIRHPRRKTNDPGITRLLDSLTHPSSAAAGSRTVSPVCDLAVEHG